MLRDIIFQETCCLLVIREKKKLSSRDLYHKTRRKDATSKTKTMDDSVNHICNVIGVNGMMRSKMVQCGISTINQLIAITEDRNEGSIRYRNEGGIQSDVLKNLLLAIKWIKENPGEELWTTLLMTCLKTRHGLNG